MSDDRSIWRDMHEKEIMLASIPISGQAMRVFWYCYKPSFGLQGKSFEELVNLQIGWGSPFHKYGLDESGWRELAIKSAIRDQAYFDACHQAAENYLWGVFQAQRCTDSLDLPEDVLGVL